MEHYRLTQDIRDRILQGLLKKYDEVHGAPHKSVDPALGRDVYLRLVGGPQRLKLIRSLPAGWLPTTTSLYVGVGNHQYTVDLAETLPIPWSAHRSRLQVTLPASSPLARRLLRHDEQRVEREDARRHMVALARTKLGAARTTQQLLAAWPEVEPFIPTAGGPRVVATTAPADLNKMLGLRPKKK